MKKDNNTIKRLLKYTNVKDLHGYFKQDDNYILCNSISVIKFDSNNIDFLDNIEPSQSIHYSYDKFNNMFKDVLKTIKDNNNTIRIDIQDLKMWKKHADKNKPFVFKIGDKYAGVNAAYLLDLALLTRQDKNNAVTIQANNNKTPLYITGNDVSAVLCPITLNKKDYSENDYNSFIDNLADCYTKEKAIQEEKAAKKAANSTKTIEKEILYNGFTFWIAGKQIFIISDKKKINDNVTKEFLNAITNVTGINCDNISDSDYKYIKSGINAATLLKTVSYYGNEEIYRIETKYNSENFYKNELDRLIIYNGNMEKIDICADDMSTETKEETPKTATIQDNNADIVADDTCTDTDKAATTDTANNDSVTDTNNRKRILHGFYMTFKNRDIFVATNEDTKRRYIVQAFISEMINISNHLQNITEEKRNNILNDEEVLKETKKRITPATIEEIWTSQENHIRITSDNNNMIVKHSLNNFKTIIIDCYSANEGGTLAQEKSLKFFSGISRLNNQLTETITQDIKADLQADNRQTETTKNTTNNAITSETMQADARQTETTQDTTPTHTATKTATSNNKSVSLFIVKDKPQPVKLLGYELPTLDRIPTYTQRIISRFKPLKNNKGYNTRVKELKPLKKAYNDFNNPVSCYSDKYAIGGGMVAVNSS